MAVDLGYCCSSQEENDKQGEEDAPWMYSMNDCCQGSDHNSGWGQGVTRISSPDQGDRCWNSDVWVHCELTSEAKWGDSAMLEGFGLVV